MTKPLLALAAFALAGAAASAQSLAPSFRPFALMGNPPPVQMLAPGFVVRELPLDLNNINNLAYAPDGRLFALGYNGNVYQLSDTDGDGLEDHASLYYRNENEIVASVGFAWGPGGLHLTGRGRIVRLRDRGDGTADLETAVTGWTPPDRTAGHYLDSYGLAFDRAGNLFFGIGIDDIRNGYRVDPQTGVSTFSLARDRGTIQRVTPDGRREIIATGLRFTVALAFNAEGDLFATDQEGATWLPNGNPLDELLHIQRDRHYGFPPRHPTYLPEVIDEPSVFDYGPQHQSTCGLHFNDPKGPNGRVFGPAWWSGDAFVVGQARGRIYRTKLVKTAAGYIARNETLAHLSMLAIDAIPTPDGGLLVTCHGGRPDWGTGPNGKGKLFKISYRDPGIAQPVFLHPAAPGEWRLVLDRPVDEPRYREWVAQAAITMGEFVSGGDRFESFRPGYQAVRDQQKAPRYHLPITGSELSADRRSITLRTLPQTAAVNYNLGLRDGTGLGRDYDASRRELRQAAAIELATDLGGVQAVWHDAEGAPGWSGWLPHLDLAAVHGLTVASDEHARLFALLRERGTLRLTTQLNLHGMLRAAVQPGSSLDFEYPKETVRVRLKASGRLDVEAPPAVRASRLAENEIELTIAEAGEAWLALTVQLATGADAPTLDVSWSTAEDARPRALALHRLLVPWATPGSPSARTDTPKEIPEIAGGDWRRGQELFHGAAACSACHQVNGRGSLLGPDLSNLVHRDYASVILDIAEPNAALNPDFLTYTAELHDGGTAGGTVVQNDSERVVLGQADGTTLAFPKANVRRLQPTGVSLMPAGLLDALDERQRKDLLTFLLMPAPSP